MKYPFIIYLVILCSLINPHTLLAQPDSIYFKPITISHGLNDNTITAICQDDEGYIWIGTHDGLHRYDGSHIKLFLKSKTFSSLPNNKIIGLKNMGRHKLGIITNEGFRVLDTKTYQGNNFQVPGEEGFFLFRNKGWDLAEVQGHGYFFTTHTGIYWFDYDGRIKWRYDHYTSQKTATTMRYGREVYPLADDKVLIYTSENYDASIFDIRRRNMLTKMEAASLLAYIPGKTRTTWRSIAGSHNWIFKTEPGSDSITGYNFQLKKITRSKLPLNNIEYAWPGRLYPGYGNTILQACRMGGFVIFTIDSTNGKVFTDGKRHLPGLRCLYLFTDNNNRIWVGTENGLYIQQFHEPAIKTFPVPVEKKQASRLPDIVDMVTTPEYLFTAAVNHRGVIQSDKKSLHPIKTILLDPDIHSDLNAILMISKHTLDTLLIGSRLGLGWYAINSGKTGIYKTLQKKGLENFSRCFADSKGFTWFSTYGPDETILARMENKTGNIELISSKKAPYYLPLSYVSYFAEDIYGNVWIGDYGLTRFNYSKNRFDTFINVFEGDRKYENNLMGLSSDKNGNLWISTLQNGLLKYNINEQTYRHFTTSDGLSSNLINEISPIINNHLFMATRNKLNMLNLGNNQVTVFAQADGLPESSITTPVIFDSTDNAVWIGYHDKLAKIPLHTPENKLPIPAFTIESITIQNDSTQYFPTGSIRLTHSQNNISIGLSSLDFDGIENNIIFYKLHRNDVWRNVEHNKFIYLDNLEPGKYELHVKLSSLARRWPDQHAYLQIIISPPFWKSWWFILLISISIVLATFALYRNRIRNIRHRNNLDKQLVELEIKALHTQMNPHFIFNCLNSIKEMIITGQKENASRYLSTFAHLLRDTLEQSTQPFTSLEENINHLERYISIEKIRFDNFNYCINLDKSIIASEIHLPPMLLQPIVENAIWHGLQPISGEKILTISFTKKGHSLLCIIEDNGIGINQSLQNKPHEKNHHSIAIENITKRIELLNEKFLLSYKLQMADKTTLPGYTGSGTIVTLTIPIYRD